MMNASKVTSMYRYAGGLSVTVKLWTTEEVAEFMRVGPATVRQWISSGSLAAVQTPGKRGVYRVEQDALDEFIRRQTVGNAA